MAPINILKINISLNVVKIVVGIIGIITFSAKSTIIYIDFKNSMLNSANQINKNREDILLTNKRIDSIGKEVFIFIQKNKS